MEDDLYHSSQEYHSITKDNSANIFKIKEEKNSNDTILMEYISHNNYVNLSQNPKSLSVCVDESKCMNLVSMDNSFDNDVSTQTTKSSLVLNYDQQMEMATSRRRQTFKCPYCPKVFCNSSAIAKHKLTHSDERKYVCDICSKAFKRQDHLNGHKYTHKVNKPHACHFCERSYSDARSLKRHYENQHQKEYKEKMATRDSGSSVDDNGPSVMDSFGFLDDHRSVRCEVCGRGFKNQSALNGHMRLHGGYGQTKNIITGPGEPKQNVPKCENSVEKILPVLPKKQLNSLNRGAQNVIITTSNSESGSLIPLLPSLPNTSTNFPSQSHSSSVRLINSPNFTNSPKYDPSLTSGPHGNSNNLPNVSIEDLCLVLQPTSIDKHLCDPCHTSSNSEKSSSPLEINTDGISYSQSATDHLLSSAGLPQNQYSPITPAYPAKNSNININLHDQNLFIYPSILNDHQINNQSFNEPDLSFENNQSDDYLLNYDKFNPGFVTSNSNSINKSWPFYDISLNSQETSDYNNSNSPSLKQISSSNNLQDILINFDNLSDSNEVTNNSVPSIIEQTIWPQYHDHNQNISLSNNVSKIMDQNILNNLDSAICPSAIINDESKNNSVLKAFIPESQPANPNKKLKIRPAPIFIPPQTSAHISLLRSPRVWNTSDSSDHKIPPYTPPPMLSPQRKGSGLFHTVRNSSLKSSLNSANSFCSWNTPFSTQAITAVSNNFCSDSIVSCIGNQQISSVIVQDYSIEKKTIEPQHFLYQDEYLDLKLHSFDDKDGLPTSATPRINIGPEYQVDLSHFYPDKHKQSYNHRDYDTLLWNPVHFKETGENISSLNLLTKIASSPAVKSCGLNMEYTFHLLFKFQGDLEKTLRALLEESLVVYDYVYAETSNWTTGEICKFQERLKAHDRDFMRVSLDLQSCGMNKSVKACVEFYYVWKHMNNTKDTDIYRKPRKKPTTRNWTHYIEEDNFPPVLDSCSAFQQVGETPYNLRRKYNSENQKLPKQMCYYGSKTSSCSSSREHSPSYQKMSKNIAIVPPHENAKKSRLSYQCCYCNRTFAKSKSLENHNRTCIQTKLSKSRTQTRNIERTPESMR